jgi:hypothetical protein
MEDIKIIKLINGDDIVCTLAKDNLPVDSPLLRLERPLQIKYVSQLTAKGLRDYIALIKWTAYTNDIIITLPKDKIVTITTATEELAKSYSDVSLKYDMIEAPKQKYEQEKKRLTKEENDLYNELWDGFRDKKKTIH